MITNSGTRLVRTKENSLRWSALCSQFVHAAKATKHLIRVGRATMWSEGFDMHQGRIYRNSYDRLNIVSVTDRNSVIEVYYFKLAWIETAGPEPEGLEPFGSSDWDYWEG